MKRILLFLVLISNLIYSQDDDCLILKKSSYNELVLRNNRNNEVIRYKKVSNLIIEKKCLKGDELVYNYHIYFDSKNNIDSIMDFVSKKTIVRYKNVYDHKNRLLERRNELNFSIERYIYFNENSNNYDIKEDFYNGKIYNKVECFYEDGLLIKEKIYSFEEDNSISTILKCEYHYNLNNDVLYLRSGYIYYNSILDEAILLYFKPNAQNFEYEYNKQNFWVKKTDIDTKEEIVREFNK
jgi:hypothetical protein